MKKLILLILTGWMAIPAFAQIKGRTLHAFTKEPVPGAAISLNNKIISITDDAGSFDIDTKKLPVTCTVQANGFKEQQVTITSSQKALIIYMVPSASQLEEVTVSTGFQKLPKERATGAFDNVDRKLFERTQAGSIISRLDGITTGLYFSKTSTAPPELNIRGLSSLTEGISSPLIVVDNFPFEGDINSINPNDVESISILKDAAAASIWGARAANGVIVITTKKAKYMQPVKWALNFNTVIQQKPDLFYSPDFIDSRSFIELEKNLFSKGYYNAILSNTTNRPIVSPVVELLAQQRAGSISQAQLDEALNAYSQNDIRKDYEKYFYRTAVNPQFSVSLSSGSDKINYILNAGFSSPQSNVRGNSERRFILSNNTSIKPFSKLELNIGFNYSNSHTASNGLADINPQSRTIYPYASLINADGTAASSPLLYRDKYLDTAGRGLLLDWKYRALDEVQQADNTKQLNDILLKLNIRYTINRHFNAELFAQTQQTFVKDRKHYNIQSFTARNLINRFTTLTGNTIKYNLPYGGILDMASAGSKTWNLRGQVNFSKTFGGIHQLTAIAGAEARETETNGDAFRTYGYNDNNLGFAAVDYITRFATYGGLGGNASIPFTGFNFTGNNDRSVSLYSNAAYTLKTKYILSVSARRDASNIFGVNTNNKWSPFWSAGLAWNVHREGWKLKDIDQLKLRLTYGYNGNTNKIFPAIPTIFTGIAANQAATNLPFAGLNNFSNSDLRWEQSAVLNAGVDFGIFNNRLSGSIDWFKKSSSDIIMSTPIDPTTGLNFLNTNSASLVSKGAEININAAIVQRKIKWNSRLLLTLVKNKVTDFRLPNSTLASYINTGYTITPRKGADPYALISYRFAGLDTAGNPVGFLEGNKSIDYAKMTANPQWESLIIHGSTRPPVFGNWINTVEWRSFNLTFNIGYRFGYYFRRNTVAYNSLFSNWTQHKDYNDRWQQAGDENRTIVPSLIYPGNSARDRFYQNSEATVSKADHIRLQDISISYRPVTSSQKSFLYNFDCYLLVSNVGILWRANKYGLDPDYGRRQPAPVQYTVGFKKNF